MAVTRSVIRKGKESIDRLGDDLTQLVLSHLPIKNKFAFECVCRQWQRLIFCGQHEVVLDFYAEDHRNAIKTPKDKHKYNLLFTHLFRKLKFLKGIECHHYLNSKTFESIITECRYIERIRFNGYAKNELFNSLFHKFGQRLVNIDLSGVFNKRFDNIFEKTPNLRQLKINKHLDHLNKCFLTKLVDIYLPLNVKTLPFSQFTDRYCKQIKTICIRFDNNATEEEVKSCLVLISKYENLEFLNLKLCLTSKRSLQLDSELKLIALKCKRLNRLSLKSSKSVTNDKLLSIVNHFKAMVKVSLFVEHWSEQTLGTMADLTDSRHIKHFKLEVNGLNDQTFADINLVLVNLQSFESNDCIKNSLSDQTLISFSRLRSLRCLSLIGKDFTESGALHLINQCPNLNYLDINYEPSQKSVDAMSAMARTRPKVNHKLFFNSWPNKPLLQFKRNKLPINLSIIQY